MGNFIEVKVKLRYDTVESIDEITKFSKVMNKYDNRDLPLTIEEVIKAAIDEYLRKIDILYQSVINHNLYGLKENLPLKNNIKKLMEEMDLSQKDLSELTDVNQPALSHILSNRNQPSMDIFLRIWIVLGCPPIEHIFYRGNE